MEAKHDQQKAHPFHFTYTLGQGMVLDYAYESNVIEEVASVLQEDANRDVVVPVGKSEIVTVGLKN